MAKQTKLYEIIMKTNNKSVASAVERIVSNFNRALKNKPEAIKKAKDPIVRKPGEFPAEWKTKAKNFKKEFSFQDLHNGEKSQQSAMNGFIVWAEENGFKAEKKAIGGRPGRPGWRFSPPAAAPKKQGKKKTWD